VIFCVFGTSYVCVGKRPRVRLCDDLQNTNVPARSMVKLQRARVSRLPQTRPSALILHCRVDWSSKLQSSPQDEVRVPQKLSTKEDDVRLAFLQVAVGLFSVEDQSDGADLDLRNGLLDTIGELNL